MRVFRIETIAGTGPYCNPAYEWSVIPGEHSSEYGRPGPCSDGLLGVDLNYNFSEYRFGFVNLRCLKTWFIRQDLTTLYELGYAVSIYESEEVIESRSGRQCMFPYEAARFIKRLPYEIIYKHAV